MIDTFKKTLWATADKLRANMDAAEYKHLVLGLIFVKYISDTFAARRTELASAQPPTSREIRPAASSSGGSRLCRITAALVRLAWPLRLSAATVWPVRLNTGAAIEIRPSPSSWSTRLQPCCRVCTISL